MKIKKFSRSRARIKSAIASYKSKIKHFEKKLFSAMRSYKESVDKERMAAASKRIKKQIKNSL